MERDYLNIVAAAAQVAGRPKARKKAVMQVIQYTTRLAGERLDQGKIEEAWKRFRAIPINHVVGF